MSEYRPPERPDPADQPPPYPSGPVPGSPPPHGDPPPYAQGPQPYTQGPPPYQPAPPPYASQPPPYASEPPPYQRMSDQQREILQTKGSRALGFGALWLVGGLVVSLVTYSNAAQSEFGGFYVIAWGPALYGVYRIISGLLMLRKSDR